MGDYTVVPEVSREIVRRLQKGLVPGVVKNPDAVALVSPSEQVSYSLSVYLYEIQMLDPMLYQSIYRERGKQSLVLCLKYMLTAASKGDAAVKAIDEQRILAGAVSVLQNDPVIKKEAFFLTEKDQDVEIRMENLSLESKSRLWGSSGAIRLSAYYTVSPVFVEAAEHLPAPRVTQLG